jgi:hypothetical protein
LSGRAGLAVHGLVWGENAGRWLEDYARILLTFSFEEKDAEGLSEIRFFFRALE